MGNIFSNSNLSMQPKINRDFEKIYENMNKRELKEPSDFSIDKMKQKAIKLFEDAKNTKDCTNKIKILEDAISFDNTNEDILRDYLILLKNINEKEFMIKLDKYYYHISEKTYKEIQGEEKKNSSIKIISEILNLFKSYETNDDLNKMVNDFTIKRNITKYFYEKENIKSSVSANSTISLEGNFELTLYQIYILLFKEINNKIDDVWKLCKDKKLKIDDKLNYICYDYKANFVKELINNYNFDESVILLYHSKLYTSVFIKVKEYISQLDEIINSCLNFKDLKTDFYILLFIILEIKNIINNEEMSLNYINKLKKYKNMALYDKDSKEFQIEGDNAIINKNINNNSIIKDYSKYYIDEILKLLKRKSKLFILNNYILYKYIKIEYFNKNNYINIMKNFIENFNDKIANSNAIISSFYVLYPELKDKKLFESEFLINLFKMALDKGYFFPFSHIKGAVTLEESGTILFFIPNRTKFKKTDLDYKPNKAYYIFLNLGIFIYNEFQEILGNFLKIILSKIVGYNYLSKNSNTSEKNEIGENIEYYLFGKAFLSFNIKQVIYLLDIYNYKKDFQEFRKDFQNIDSIEYIPSNDFMNMIKLIDLDISLIDMNNKNMIRNLFKEKYIFDEISVELPYLNNCCENFELGQDESLINLLKSENDKISL